MEKRYIFIHAFDTQNDGRYFGQRTYQAIQRAACFIKDFPGNTIICIGGKRKLVASIEKSLIEKLKETGNSASFIFFLQNENNVLSELIAFNDFFKEEKIDNLYISCSVWRFLALKKPWSEIDKKIALHRIATKPALFKRPLIISVARSY